MSFHASEAETLPEARDDAVAPHRHGGLDCHCRTLPVQSGLVRALLSGEFAVTAELVPPASCSVDALLDKAAPLSGRVDAVNVTDGAGARAHMSSLIAATFLAQHGLEPVLQMTCRDRNRLALQSDLLGAGAAGIVNMLALGGDSPAAGDQPEAKPVFDLDTPALVATMQQMSATGTMPSGRPIATPPDFFIGVAETPVDPEPGWRPDRLLAKIDAGAQFMQTQFCYDIGILRRYAERLHDSGVTERCFFLAGTGPIASARSALWMREHLWGTVIPDAVIERLADAPDPRLEGQRICIELIQQMQEIDGIAGVHVMAIGQQEAIPSILAEAGIGPACRDSSAAGGRSH
ncbi:methylenetetrahydrofolate reductase [Marinibaculum pumilum]|uniref:Methylenetetrahydrofolate reductase n=1 Tax=Marinibaculum pumilum TaxID=1766165 RepID=A0ABV7L0I3_9PROT